MTIPIEALRPEEADYSEFGFAIRLYNEKGEKMARVRSLTYGAKDGRIQGPILHPVIPYFGGTEDEAREWAELYFAIEELSDKGWTYKIEQVAFIPTDGSLED